MLNILKKNYLLFFIRPTGRSCVVRVEQSPLPSIMSLPPSAMSLPLCRCEWFYQKSMSVMNNLAKHKAVVCWEGMLSVSMKGRVSNL